MENRFYCPLNDSELVSGYCDFGAVELLPLGGFFSLALHDRSSQSLPV